MGEDFMLEGRMQTFSYQGNMTMICLGFRVIDDQLIENQEGVAIEVTLDNPIDVISGFNRTKISITDNDCKYFVKYAI